VFSAQDLLTHHTLTDTQQKHCRLRRVGTKRRKEEGRPRHGEPQKKTGERGVKRIEEERRGEREEERRGGERRGEERRGEERRIREVLQDAVTTTRLKGGNLGWRPRLGGVLGGAGWRLWADVPRTLNLRRFVRVAFSAAFFPPFSTTAHYES